MNHHMWTTWTAGMYVCVYGPFCRAPASKWSPRPPGPTPSGAPARASRPSNDIPQIPPSSRVSPRQLPPGNRLSPRPSNDGGRISPGGGVSPIGGRVSPIGGRISPIGGRVSPVGAGNYPSAAKVVADAHAAQVQRQKALAAQQAQRQQARAQLEEEKKRLALVRCPTIADPESRCVLMLQQQLHWDRLVDRFAHCVQLCLIWPVSVTAWYAA